MLVYVLDDVEGLLNIVLQKAEGLANIGEVLIFICETLQTTEICLRCSGDR